MKNTALRIVVVRDGRPGHEKQSLGLVTALRKRYDVQLRELTIQRGGRAFFQTMRIVLGRDIEELSTFHPHLIIGTGSRTHPAMLALKWRLGGHAVVCMSPMSLLRVFFDLCCIPRHDRPRQGKNIFLTDGPPGINGNLHQHDPDCALVLVGGIDEKSHVWDNQSISRYIAETIERYPRLQWTLTTSPRTPADFLDTFTAQCPSISVHICPFASTGPGWLEQQLNRSRWVLVTEDSLSMLFEALSAGCHIATVPVAFHNENKFVRCLSDLKQRGLVAATIDLSRPDRAEGFNEAQRCAEFLEMQSWWPCR